MYRWKKNRYCLTNSEETYKLFRWYYENWLTKKNKNDLYLHKVKKIISGSSHCGSMVTNQTSIQEDAGLTPGLAQWVKYTMLLCAVV